MTNTRNYYPSYSTSPQFLKNNKNRKRTTQKNNKSSYYTPKGAAVAAATEETTTKSTSFQYSLHQPPRAFDPLRFIHSFVVPSSRRALERKLDWKEEDEYTFLSAAAGSLSLSLLRTHSGSLVRSFRFCLLGAAIRKLRRCHNFPPNGRQTSG